MSKSKRKAKKTSKTLKIVSSIFGITLLIVNILLFYIIFELNVIPTKYFTMICCVLLPILIILEIFLTIPKIKSNIKKVAIGISTVFIILISIILYYLYNTN